MKKIEKEKDREIKGEIERVRKRERTFIADEVVRENISLKKSLRKREKEK